MVIRLLFMSLKTRKIGPFDRSEVNRQHLFAVFILLLFLRSHLRQNRVIYKLGHHSCLEIFSKYVTLRRALRKISYFARLINRDYDKEWRKKNRDTLYDAVNDRDR